MFKPFVYAGFKIFVVALALKQLLAIALGLCSPFCDVAL